MSKLGELLRALEEMAPLVYAEPWDNVGLLVEGEVEVKSALLCIDLDDAVVDEAERLGVGLIVAYHPPIFEGVKRLRTVAPKERVLLRAARAGMSLYSPHTALDATPDGINDWMLEAFGETRTRPITPAKVPGAPALAGAGRIAELKRPFDLHAAVAA